MIFNYNYFKNLEDFDFYLCNPDGEELYSIAVQDVNFSLRFNDISTLTFNVSGSAEDADGNKITQEYYDLLETRRLIYVNNIGWFTIRSVVNTDNGYEDIKSIEAESLQATFKDRGFVSEERVYCIYNTADSYDAAYDPEDEAAIPSVVGQMYQQLGINQDFITAGTTIESAYDEWTIIHVDDELKYHGDREASDVLFRTMNEETTFGYDWLINSVENAFGVVIDFDFFLKTIEIKTVANATKMSDACLTFSNVMNTLEVTEDASNIVTVLSCTGKDIDITEVNPTGTNYVADFSYYMDEESYQWMSRELIEVLKSWKAACDSEKSEYSGIINSLYSSYETKSRYEEELEQLSLELKDLKAARDNYYMTNVAGVNPTTSEYLHGIVTAETVDVGSKSALSGSSFYSDPFSLESSIGVYFSAPSGYTKPTSGKGYFSFTGDPVETRASKLEFNASTKIYFFDTSSKTSYCALNVKVERISGGKEPLERYVCSGFTRYVTLDPLVLKDWISKKESRVKTLNNLISNVDSSITGYKNRLKEISGTLNLLKYVGSHSTGEKSGEDLLKELNAYWIEGDYSNDNISSYEDATQGELIKLANELLEAGELELEKVSQPRYSFSVSADSVIGAYELKNVVGELILGSVVTTERKEGVWYYPALLEMSFSLEERTLTLSFANALRLDDWGYTFADLVSGAANTSRKVSANWQNLMEYARDKAEIEPLIKNPLDATLRASFSNLTNQNFQVDSTGILGRKRKEGETASDEDVFEGEQIRLLNNLIIFTDNGWESARAAFGKISYKAGGATKTSYGLIADTLIGSLILGEAMKISNGSKTISLDGDGITIKKGSTTLFAADSTTGNVTVRGTIYASAGNIAGWTIKEDYFGNYGGGISDTYFLSPTGKSATANVDSKKDLWALYYKGNFAVSTNGTLYAKDAHITGAITATSGSFTGTVNAKDGYFKGEINATSGSFSRSLTVGGKAVSTWINSSGNIYRVNATEGNFGAWILGDASHPTSLYAERSFGYGTSDKVFLMPDGIRLEERRVNTSGTIVMTSYETTWKKLIQAANK